MIAYIIAASAFTLCLGLGLICWGARNRWHADDEAKREETILAEARQKAPLPAWYQQVHKNRLRYFYVHEQCGEGEGREP